MVPKKTKNTRIITLSELRHLKSSIPSKKGLMIKDISKVLNEIEDTKKKREILYFSSFYKKKIFDSSNRFVGYLKDLAIAGGERFPEVSHILVKQKRELYLVPWKNVSSFNTRVILDRPFVMVEKREIQDDDVFLGNNILDKQVVDVNGLKVIRVNDIALTYMKSKLAVISIDVGSRAILRRLGFERIADIIPFSFSDHPLPWESVEPLTRSIEKIRLKVPCAKVSDLHPADVAGLFDELSFRERNILLKSMKSETAAKVILECEPDVRDSIVKSLKTKRLAMILERMPPNDAANLISVHGAFKRDAILKSMAKPNASKIQQMLSFKEGSVARYMEETFLTINSEFMIQEAIDYIRALPKRPKNFHYIYILDEMQSLKGVLSLKNLLFADPASKLKDIMVTKIITIDMSDPIEIVEEIMSKHDLVSLPVVDINGKIRGVINIDDVLDVVMERTKLNKPVELSDHEKDDLNKKKKLKKHYSSFVKDIGQFLSDFDGIRPKKRV